MTAAGERPATDPAPIGQSKRARTVRARLFNSGRTIGTQGTAVNGSPPPLARVFKRFSGRSGAAPDPAPPPASRAAWALAFLLVSGLAITVPAAAEEGTPAGARPAPIWVPVPKKIDRAEQAARPDRPQPEDKDRFDLAIPSTVQISPAGEMQVGGMRYRLAGLDTIPSDRICTATTGARWTCGRRANLFIAAQVRGRQLKCRVEADGGASTATPIDCLLAGRPVSVVVAEAGWAYPTLNASEDVARAADTAKRARRGLYADGPE